jgi:microcompartment protein CcmK/EutM
MHLARVTGVVVPRKNPHHWWEKLLLVRRVSADGDFPRPQ